MKNYGQGNIDQIYTMNASVVLYIGQIAEQLTMNLTFFNPLFPAITKETLQLNAQAAVGFEFYCQSVTGIATATCASAYPKAARH